MNTRAPAPEPAVLEPASTSDDPTRPGLLGRLSAEALGTFFVVIAGLGVPLFTIPQSSPLPASLAAGLALTAAMLAFGYLSGGHFNPAVTAGNAIAGRIRLADAAAYVGAQLVGALLAAVTLFGLLRTVPNITDTRTAFDTVAAGFGEHSVIQAPMAGVLLIEVLGAALLVAVYLGTTSARNPSRLAAPFAVGLTTAVLLQFGQAPGNTPFNPARATASALFSSPDVLGQLWLFWVAPLVGAALAGLVYRGFARTAPAAVTVPVPDTAPETGDDDGPDAGPDGGDARVSAPADTGSDEARDFFDAGPGAGAGRGTRPGHGE
ncbi:MIP/aquaporin family protein [Arthrobacter sp. PsM3]|uniref:MIP/aquaporin family protein n=1 Tax=Arthrobacter sp. PsM3 TaxID=3030531 RepID=UPI00263A8E50|nr:aquaporin [Arthrobacter sp. PsM3]MDN4643512.1 aquaporin [Arthrobacter sp. PsM3]